MRELTEDDCLEVWKHLEKVKGFATAICVALPCSNSRGVSLMLPYIQRMHDELDAVQAKLQDLHTKLTERDHGEE